MDPRFTGHFFQDECVNGKLALATRLYQSVVLGIVGLYVVLVLWG